MTLAGSRHTRIGKQAYLGILQGLQQNGPPADWLETIARAKKYVPICRCFRGPEDAVHNGNLGDPVLAVDAKDLIEAEAKGWCAHIQTVVPAAWSL